MNNCLKITIFILLLVILLTILIFGCNNKELFTVPGLTLIKPPSWFPQNAAKGYDRKDWETKMYLDRYSSRQHDHFISSDEMNEKASTDRFWK